MSTKKKTTKKVSSKYLVVWEKFDDDDPAEECEELASVHEFIRGLLADGVDLENIRIYKVIKKAGVLSLNIKF